jgi:integrase
MATRSLSVRFVASLRAPAVGRIEVFDAVVPGLSVRITDRGVKSWSCRYRHHGRTRRVTLGRVSAVGLSEARDRARDLLHEARDGADPATMKRERRAAPTVAAVAADYLERYAKVRKKSWRQDRRHLRCQVLPTWKHRAMRETTKRDVRVLLDGIVARGAPVLANRVHSLVSKLCAFAVSADLMDRNIVRDVPRPAREHARTRVLDDAELRTFWRVTETLDLGLRALWRIRLLTAKRPGEVLNMRWADVDLETAWWTNPGTAEKNSVAHRVSLSTPVVQMLGDLPASRDGFTFAGLRTRGRHAVAFPFPDFQPKDLRRTAATGLSRAGVPDSTIDAVLNHKKQGIIRVYNLNTYDAEKRAALDAWALLLAQIVATPA